MPPKMMTETPLPMPFSVINSPSQTRNIVPAARVRRVESVPIGWLMMPKSWTTSPPLCPLMKTIWPYPWTNAMIGAIQCV